LGDRAQGAGFKLLKEDDRGEKGEKKEGLKGK